MKFSKVTFLIAALLIALAGCSSGKKRRSQNQPQETPFNEQEVQKAAQKSLDKWSRSIANKDRKTFWNYSMTDFKTQNFKDAYFNALCKTWELRSKLRKAFEIDETAESFKESDLVNQGFNDCPWLRISAFVDLKFKIEGYTCPIYGGKYIPPGNFDWSESDLWKVSRNMVLYRYKYTPYIYEASHVFIEIIKIKDQWKVSLKMAYFFEDKNKAESIYTAELEKFNKKLDLLLKYIEGKTEEQIDLEEMREILKSV